jgi:hypothetical protein
LQLRYRQLVLEHLQVADPLTAGIHALAVPGLADGFAAVLGAHRFLYNAHVRLPCLAEPLQQVAQHWRQQAPQAWALLVHDWSTLKYPHHRRKTDQARLSHAQDRGYELTTLLLVDGRQGDPITPVHLHLRSARAVHSTRLHAPKRNAFRVDDVLASMDAVAEQPLGPRVAHIIDREADSLAHYRDWHAAGHCFLVRADQERMVRWHGAEWSVAQLGDRLHRAGQFRRSRKISYQGHAAVQYVAEVTVVLDRPAWRHRRRGGRTINQRVPGAPLTLRLVISRVCNARGETVAVWYLLSNVPPEVDAATLALWYYWRWRIESLFKLLKSAGHQVEHWQQQNGEALAKRLLVAAMACTVVWQVARHPAPEAASLRALLIQLSGRQMKWGREHTAPALLAGLWVLLAMLEALEEHSVEQLRQYKKLVLDSQVADSG